MVNIIKLKEDIKKLKDKQCEIIDKARVCEYGSSKREKFLDKSDAIREKIYKLRDKCPHSDRDEFYKVAGTEIAKCNICGYYIERKDLREKGNAKKR
jgi:hypothetical protein